MLQVNQYIELTLKGHVVYRASGLVKLSWVSFKVGYIVNSTHLQELANILNSDVPYSVFQSMTSRDLIHSK